MQKRGVGDDTKREGILL